MTTRRTALGLFSAAALVPALPRSGLAQTIGLSIRVTAPPLAVAPMGVFLEAVLQEDLAHSTMAGGAALPDAYRAGFHEVTYVWSLPDQGPVRTPDHLVDDHRRTDQAMGPYIARVFETPGRHRVSVDVFLPDGRYGRAETVVDVADPADAFDASNTIVVSANGDVSGAPAHRPENAVTDLETAFRKYGRLSSPHAQILLARDQEYFEDSDRAMQFVDQIPHCHIGAWGEGARPIINVSNRSAGLFVLQPEWDGHALVVRDIHFRGGWDPTVELWRGVEQSSLLSTRGNAALLLHDCREDGCAVTLNSRPPPDEDDGTQPAMTFFNEYAKTDFKDFLLLGPRDNVDVAITGCRVVQHPQALNGGENRRTTSYALYGRNAHNFIRCSARRLYVASNDIFMRHGWAFNKVFDNAAFRLNRNDAADMRAVIARNHIEGMIKRFSRNGAVPTNLLIEQNYIVSNPTDPRSILITGGAATVRNNIIIEHNTAKLPKSGRGFEAFVFLAWDGKNTTTRDMPIFVYNNSFILLRDDATVRHGPNGVFNKDGGFTNVIEANNLLWAPAMSYDPTGDGPLDVTPLPWDARYHGVRLGWERLTDGMLPQQMFPGDRMRIPYWTDFFGNRLSQADFAGQTGRHALVLKLDGERFSYGAREDEITVEFASDGVVVTNLSGARWPQGTEFALHCDRGTTPSAMQTAYGQPEGTLSLYRPVPNAGAWQSGTQDARAIYDFLGKLRPGTAHPDAPLGTASRGALEG